MYPVGRMPTDIKWAIQKASCSSERCLSPSSRNACALIYIAKGLYF